MIFTNAVRHVVGNPAQALRIIALPLIVNVAAEVYSAHQYIRSDYTAEGHGIWIALFANFLATAFIAVAMHRAILLDERAGFWPTSGGSLYYRYIVQWLIIGLVIMLLMLAVFGALALVLWLVADIFAFSYLFEDLLAYTDPFNIPFYIGNLIIVTAFTALFFRCGAVLPHLAIGKAQVGMWAGWDLTKPLAKPIFIAAVYAGIAQVLMLWAPTDVLILALEDSEGNLPFAYDYIDAVLLGVFYCLPPLFGAAILTEIHRNIGVQAFDNA